MADAHEAPTRPAGVCVPTIASMSGLDGRQEPVVVAVAHAKGGVGKTATTLIVGKYRSRQFRAELRDDSTVPRRSPPPTQCVTTDWRQMRGLHRLHWYRRPQARVGAYQLIDH